MYGRSRNEWHTADKCTIHSHGMYSVIGNLYVGDPGNLNIRKISTSGNVTTILDKSNPNSISPTFFNQINGVATDAVGNIFVVEAGYSRIRKINPSGVISTLAGGGSNGISEGFANGFGNQALFTSPTGIAIDAAGNAYVADRGNFQIRKINISTGQVTTFAGNGTRGSADGLGTAASFENLLSISTDLS